MSTISITQVAAPTGGRHRIGGPGLVSLAALGIVVRRGILAWFRTGRHRSATPRRADRVAPARVPAAV